MSSSNHSQVQSLAQEFLELCRAGNAPTIESYCSKFPELAGEIREVFEALLLIEDLKPNSDELTFAEVGKPAKPTIPNVVGGYRIVREIGRGGMGIVYEATHETLNRHVALKVLSASNAIGNEAAIIRFEQEARAAARMHHTNIVPLFEVGRENGLLFYAMQLISGKSLDLIIEEVRRATSDDNRLALQPREGTPAQPATERPQDVRTKAGTQGRSSKDTHSLHSSSHSDSHVSDIFQDGLSNSSSSGWGSYFKSVADIGLQTARALSYAHARGVVHRDIKPANLLLDENGTAWVTDFGLAKTDDDAITGTGDILGTLRYMSPERFQGVCDARSDIYAIGLTLYELLARQPAFTAQDRLQLIDLVSKGGVNSLRQLDPRIPKDLETIVAKCVHVDPHHRYQNADELGDELLRFINGEPIQSRPISNLEITARWCRRNPSIAVSVFAAVTAMIVGSAVSLSLAHKARRAESLANERLERIQEEQAQTQLALKLAESERNKAKDAEKESATQAATAIAINNFLMQDLLAEAAPSQNSREKQVTVEELVLRAATRISEKFQDQPLVQAELRVTIGKTLAALSNLDAALKQLKIALDIRIQELGPEDPATIRLVSEIGVLHAWRGENTLAETNYKQALGLQTKILGDLHQDTLTTMNDLAMLYSRMEKYDLAEKWFVKALDGLKKTLGDSHRDTLETINSLAGLYRSMENFDRAEELFEEALTLREDSFGAEHPDTLTSKGDLSLWHMKSGNFERATELLESVVATSSRVSGEDHFVTLIYKNNLADLYRRMGNLADSERLLRFVLEQRKKTLPAGHDHTITNMLQLGNLCRDRGDFESAEGFYDEWIAAIAQKSGNESKAFAAALDHFGMELVRHERFEKAKKVITRCLDIQLTHGFGNRLQIADMQHILGAVIAHEGFEIRDSAPAESKKLLQEAEEMLIENHQIIADSDFGKTPMGIGRQLEQIDRIIIFYKRRNTTGDDKLLTKWQEQREAIQSPPT